VVGVGAFGRVYKAKLQKTDSEDDTRIVAVKTIKSRGNNQHIRSFEAEAKILMYIGRHVNIINLIGVCTEDYIKKGTISKIILRYEILS